MTIVRPGWAFRWAGGSFVTAHTAERVDEHVPDEMIGLPESLNHSKATREDIEALIDRHLGAAAR